MKKRLLSLALCLALCLGLFPFGVLATDGGRVYEGTGDPEAASVISVNGTTTNYATLPAALNAARDGDTVKLLENHTTNWSNVEAGEEQMAVVKTRITLDLNGNTVDYLVVDEVVPDEEGGILDSYDGNLTVQSSQSGGTAMDGQITTLKFVRGTLAVQDGVIIGSSLSSPSGLICEANSGTVTISGGMVYNATVGTGAAVTVSGGSMHQGEWVNNGTLNITGGTFGSVKFNNNNGTIAISGGTFSTLQNFDNTSDWPIAPMSLLAPGHAFYKDNTVQDGSVRYFLQDVTVKEHTHTMVNNKCACGYTCPHTSVDANGACTVCHKQIAASVTAGEDVTYYDKLGKALNYANQNKGCTLKLLANVESAVSVEAPLIFDLNGHNVQGLSVCAKATIQDSGTEKGKIGKVLIFDKEGEKTNLTLGDLLEEGYAFKYENDTWVNDSHVQTSDGPSVTVEKAPIQSVAVFAKDKNNNEVSTNMAYGTTGEVTLVSSCQMGETSGADLTYLWYKLEGAAATAPLEGATGANYTLPDNLAAGTHTYLLICTSDGYSKSKEITITVTPISLEDAEVTVQSPTYNGKLQEPKVTVKLGDKTLSRDNDYTMEVPKQTDAGSYKLTIKGGGNYSGTIEKDWKIEPIKIDHVEVSSDISKTYDGTATVTKTAEEWATALTFKTRSASGVVDVPSSAYTISDVCFVTKNAAGEYVASPEVGEKNIQFTVTFKNNNYVLQTALDNQPASSKTYNQSGLADFTIKQATVTSPGEITQLVFNDLAKTYTIDLAALLPELSEGCEYGDIQYQGCDYHFTDSTYLDSNNGMSVSKEGILTLPTVSAHTSDVNTQIGTITVPVVTTNYQKFEFTIKVYIRERIPPNASGVTVSASDITYGQTLNESKLTATGTMKHPGTGEEVKGTFAWTNPEAKPGAAGDYTASWTFTPAEGYEEYAPATGEVAVKVNPKSIEGAKVALGDSLTYNGSEQTQAVTSVKLDETTLTAGTDYTISGNTGKDAKGYKLTISGTGNYTGEVKQAYTIARKAVTATVTVTGSYTYTGKAIEPTFTVEDEGTTIPASEYTVSYENNTNAGTAKIILKDNDVGNYIVSGGAEFTIDKAQATCTPPTANDLTYNGTAQELFKAATTQDGTTLYSMSKTSDFLPDVPLITRAGTYTFYYQVRGDSNHTDSDIGTITVTIKKAPLTITAKDKSAYVGSTAPDLSNPELNKDYTVSGLFGRDQLTKSPVLSYATEKPDMSQIGSVDINISDADARRNYTITYVSGKLNITTRSSSSGSSNSGTKTDTVKNPDGSTTKTETKADGSKTETTTASSAGGSTGTTVTKTDAKGNTTTEASAKLSDRAVTEAQEKGEAVTVPVKGIAAAKDANAATKIKIDVPNNANKTTVEIPVENVTSGTVAVIVHEDGTEELVKDSKPTEHGVQLELSGSTTVKIIDNSKTFDDTKGHWSQDDVNFVAARELFNGVGGNQFGVSQPMTRGMVNTVLARLAGVDTTPSQGQAWYEVGTDWAKKNGISDGTNPTAPVTREQLATLLYRYAGSPSVSGTLHAADAASVSDYAEDALLWANQNGIVNGVGSNTIAPKDNAQRAQVAAMLARYLQNQ